MAGKTSKEDSVVIEVPLALPKEAPMIEVNFEDGCRFWMENEPRDGEWFLNLPGGFEVTCPHGHTNGI